jgi:hypothetical protein
MSTGKQDGSKDYNAFMFRVRNICLPDVGKYIAAHEDLIFSNKAIRKSALPTCSKLKSQQEAIWIFALYYLSYYARNPCSSS